MAYTFICFNWQIIVAVVGGGGGGGGDIA